MLWDSCVLTRSSWLKITCVGPSPGDCLAVIRTQSPVADSSTAGIFWNFTAPVDSEPDPGAAIASKYSQPHAPARRCSTNWRAKGGSSAKLVAQPLLQVDAHVRMRGEKRAQRFGQKFGERIGVREHPDLAGEAARVGAEVFVQTLGLAQDAARMLEQRAPGLGRRHSLPAPHQQRRPERPLHMADARAGSGKRQMRALGALGDAPGLDNVAEQVEVDEVEAHGTLPVWRRQAMPDTHCARSFQRYVSPTAKSKRIRVGR